MSKVFLAGNSHIVALRTAAFRRGGFTTFPLGNGRYEMTTFSERTDRGVRFTDADLADRLARHAKLDQITPGPTWGFLQINHNARIYQHPCWRRFEPAGIARRGTTSVSEAVVRSIIEDDHAGVRQFFGHLQDAGVNFFAISGPPARRDHYAIEEGTRGEIVQYVDRLSREMWADWLRAQRIPLIDPPAESVDDDGFLRPEYARVQMGNGEPDPHHANELYGDLMIDKIVAHLGTTTHRDAANSGID